MSGAALARVLAYEGSGWRSGHALLLALAAHAALLAAATFVEPPRQALVAVTEVELAPPPPPREPTPPPPPPPPPAAAAPPAHVPRARLPRAQAPRPPAAAPAPAPALRTVDESVRDEQPVRFATDPSGSAFAFGNVTSGAQAQAPTHTSAAPAAPRRASPPELSKPPQLAESEPCRGYFPQAARSDRGQVTLRVRVEQDGAVLRVSVADEAPRGEGFGAAARACLLAKRFSAALDREGRPVAVLTPVTVRFAR